MCKSIRYSVVTERVKSILFRIWNFSSQRLICRMYFLCSPQSVSARKYFAANSQCKYFTGTRSHGRLPTIIGAFYHEFLLQTLLTQLDQLEHQDCLQNGQNSECLRAVFSCIQTILTPCIMWTPRQLCVLIVD